MIIPNLGPNRYALSVVPPNQSGWAQTTTLEGNHDWDAWVMEGATGLDTEFVVAGEPFPATFFGYVQPTNTMGAGSGEIKGTALAVSAYIPPVGGITGETGLLGAKPKDKNPIHSLYVSLSDLNNNDQTVFMGHFDCSMWPPADAVTSTSPSVPDGDYVLGVWDEPQDYHLPRTECLAFKMANSSIWVHYPCSAGGPPSKAMSSTISTRTARWIRASRVSPTSPS